MPTSTTPSAPLAARPRGPHRHWPLLLLLSLTAILLFAAIDFGLPRTDLGQDERITAARVRGHYPEGDDKVPRYNWPELQPRLGRAVEAAVRPIERALGLEPLHPYLLGRATVALLALGMVAALYFTGVALLGRRAGTLAAALLPAMPLFTFRSRLWVPDAPMTAFYTLALLASVLAARRPRFGRFALAGAAVGLAAGAKYNGAGAAFAVVVAGLLAARDLPRGRRLALTSARLVLAGACSLVVFVLTTPGVVTDTQAFLHGVSWVGDVYTDEPPSGFLGRHVLRAVGHAFLIGRPEGVGPLLCALALIGATLLLLRDRWAASLALLPGALYAVTFASLLHNAYERLFMPLLPHLALAGGYALAAGLGALEARLPPRRASRLAAASIAGIVVAVAWMPVVLEARAASRGDTRMEALDWIEARVPQGATIFREWNMVRPRSTLFAANGRDRTLYALGLTAEEIAARHDFVVVTSLMYDWVFRQRERPGFAERAALYEAVFEGPRFELLHAVEPDRGAIGPAVRIYRTLPPRGPRFGPRRRSLDLLSRAWVNSPGLRAGASDGEIRLVRPWDAAAGRFVLRRAGTYRLELAASARVPTAVRLTVGDTTRRIVVDDEVHGAVRTRLPRGQVWWSVRSGEEPGEQTPLTVHAVRLLREPDGPR